MATSTLPLEEVAEIRELSKEAFIYGFPMVELYGILHSFFIDKASSQYKGRANTIKHVPKVFTPEDTAVITPNSDTPYSWLAMDLRKGPLILQQPPMEDSRYFSLMLLDLYTHVFGVVGTRTDGNNGSLVMVVGPGWIVKQRERKEEDGKTHDEDGGGNKHSEDFLENGAASAHAVEVPPGVDRVIHCETEFAMGVYRTQLFRPSDLTRVIAIQNDYRVLPLDEYLTECGAKALKDAECGEKTRKRTECREKAQEDTNGGEKAPKGAGGQTSFVQGVLPASQLPWPKYTRERAMGLGFLTYLRSQLRFCPVHPSEKALRARLERLFMLVGNGDEAEMKIDLAAAKAVKEGFALALRQVENARRETQDASTLFGSRGFLQNDYLRRTVGANMGIGGLVKEEAYYWPYHEDSEGRALDTSNHQRYQVRFPAGQLPPASAFWSLTMYDKQTQLLVENPIQRYLINSALVPELVQDEDGGITIFIQRDQPEESDTRARTNWLPGPDGQVYLVLRCYLPKKEVLNGTWTPPVIENVSQ